VHFLFSVADTFESDDIDADDVVAIYKVDLDSSTQEAFEEYRYVTPQILIPRFACRRQCQ